MVSYRVTLQTSSVVEQFRRVALDVENHLVAASSAARDEWTRFLRLWPTDDELRSGAITVSNDDLSWMLERARRFRALVAGRSDASGPPVDQSTD